MGFPGVSEAFPRVSSCARSVLLFSASIGASGDSRAFLGVVIGFMDVPMYSWNTSLNVLNRLESNLKSFCNFLKSPRNSPESPGNCSGTLGKIPGNL